MNNKGFISIQYLFSIFLLILIATGILFVAIAYVDSSQNIEMHVSSRIILDDVCNAINQVNSNGEGYSKIITLPDKVNGYRYTIEVSKNEIVFKGGGKMAQGNTMPFTLVNNKITISKIDLYGGNSYIIKKHENSQISISLLGSNYG